jgi:hypothetical protein
MARARIKNFVSQVTARTDYRMVVPRHSSILTEVKSLLKNVSSTYIFS